MKKVMNLMAILFLVAGLGLCSTSSARAAGPQEDQAILKVVKNEMHKRTIGSGTLDLYDTNIKAVRNLRLLSFPEKVKKQGDKFAASIDYRDIHRGDIVTVEALVAPKGDSYTVSGVKITNVQPVKKNVQTKKSYSDKEIQDFMMKYINDQSKFTGNLMLYDAENKVMRHLKLKELNPKVRRMGIYYISRAVFDDINTGDILDVDISVQNTNGQLEMQALRIRNVRKGMHKAKQ